MLYNFFHRLSHLYLCGERLYFQDSYTFTSRGSLARQGGGFEIHCPQGRGSSNLPPGAMLSDRDIVEALRTGKIEIKKFSEDCLTPNGYDLRIGEILVPSLGIYITTGKVKIPPLTRFLVGTLEEVHLDERHVAQLWIKSRWARRGVLASFGLVDAGFNGILTIGAFATEEIEISIGDKFAQICFFELKNPAEKDYSNRSGHYQNQKNIKI